MARIANSSDWEMGEFANIPGMARDIAQFSTFAERTASPEFVGSSAASAFFQKFPGNNHALDLVCTFVDLADLGIAVEALNFKATNIAGATKNLDGI